MRLETGWQEWMRESRLSIKEKLTGCITCEPFHTEQPVIASLFKEPVVPQYELSYITPEVEKVKQRSETHSAHLNFTVGQHTVVRHYKNNNRILDRVDSIIRAIRHDDNLQVTHFRVTGYASPEGNAQSNLALSRSRAYAFVNYLSNKWGIQHHQLTVDWKGEDWQGLRQAVAVTNIDSKEAILSIIDNEPDVDRRKQKLRALNGGATCRTLLEEFYPQLRRNDYEIAYIARPFNIEEAKALIKTKPQYLSLNEMYILANSYPKNSKEFMQVFDVAARLYPHEPIAQLNVAVTELESGATDVAIARLRKIQFPEALNNLGVACILKKEYAKGKEYFEQAAKAGVKSAVHNLKELTRWMESLQKPESSVSRSESQQATAPITLSRSAGVSTRAVPAQRFAIKTNLLYDATTTLNLGMEMRVAPKWTLDLSANLNPWEFGNNRKFKHLTVQPEARYWLCESFNGHFFGVHLLGGIFNIGGIDLNTPNLGSVNLLNLEKQYRYEGWAAGAGITYGYQWLLGKRWSLEAAIGLGYLHAEYDRYECRECGKKLDKDVKKEFITPTKAAISIIYFIK